MDPFTKKYKDKMDKISKIWILMEDLAELHHFLAEYYSLLPCYQVLNN